MLTRLASRSPIIDDDGFLYVDEIGGWDAQVLVGQRVTVLSKETDITGVVGKKPIHLIKSEEREKATKVRDLWIDVGAEGREAATALGIRVGDPVVIDAPVVRLAGDRIASRAVDTALVRMSCWKPCVACLNSQGGRAPWPSPRSKEEIGYTGGGARTSAYSVEPDVAIVVDVTFSTDVPDIEKKEIGDHRLGGGPVLSRAPRHTPTSLSASRRWRRRRGSLIRFRPLPRLRERTRTASIS